MDVAEIERRWAKLRPQPDGRVDLRTLEAFSVVYVGGPDVDIRHTEARFDVALNGGLAIGIGDATRDVVARERGAEREIERPFWGREGRGRFHRGSWRPGNGSGAISWSIAAALPIRRSIAPGATIVATIGWRRAALPSVIINLIPPGSRLHTRRASYAHCPP